MQYSMHELKVAKEDKELFKIYAINVVVNHSVTTKVRRLMIQTEGHAKTERTVALKANIGGICAEKAAGEDAPDASKQDKHIHTLSKDVLPANANTDDKQLKIQMQAKHAESKKQQSELQRGENGAEAQIIVSKFAADAILGFEVSQVLYDKEFTIKQDGLGTKFLAGLKKLGALEVRYTSLRPLYSLKFNELEQYNVLRKANDDKLETLKLLGDRAATSRISLKAEIPNNYVSTADVTQNRVKGILLHHAEQDSHSLLLLFA